MKIFLNVLSGRLGGFVQNSFTSEKKNWIHPASSPFYHKLTKRLHTAILRFAQNRWSRSWDKLSLTAPKVNLEKLIVCLKKVCIFWAPFYEKLIGFPKVWIFWMAYHKFPFDVKRVGPTGIRTQVARFKVWSDNHYTMEPFYVSSP